MNEWISVKERLPENGQKCLVFIKDKHFRECDMLSVAEFLDDGQYRSWKYVFEGSSAITHWMPLPEAPTI